MSFPRDTPEQQCVKLSEDNLKLRAELERVGWQLERVLTALTERDRELEQAKAELERVNGELSRVKAITGWPGPVLPVDVAVAYLHAAEDDINTQHYAEAKAEVGKAIVCLAQKQREAGL